TGRAKRGARHETADADAELASLRDKLRRHPAHRAPDRDTKLRIAERYLRIERDNAQLQKKVAAATNSLARTFDRIVGLLTERGFIQVSDGADGDRQVTDDGRLLARIYSESDLLVAECLRSGAWAQLGPAELAAVVSTVLYEARGSADSRGAGTPAGGRESTPRLRQALVRTRRLSGTLRADEQRHRITPSREPDDGFVDAIYQWASTGDLSAALAAAEESGSGSALSAGDFVRWCRQVLDLLDQVRNTAPEPNLRGSAKRAIEAVRRGVVAVDAE
ncbi:MAG TPA: DEAD/DEAH box helicase, partial [Mycobacterium sp.]|nr:DEAD/DEAH box helicase [Mycobacterium sp.]